MPYDSGTSKSCAKAPVAASRKKIRAIFFIMGIFNGFYITRVGMDNAAKLHKICKSER